MRHWLNLSDAELSDWLVQRGAAPYRGGQVRRWLFARRAGSFAEMTDLPAGLREELAAAFCLWSAAVTAQQRADDGTEKLLFQWPDGHQIESVLLRAADGRRTICISTQVGCAMGCVFCASGLDGVVRNLTTGEIVEQMLQLQRRLEPQERLSHVVVMGMGEPLANLANLLPALDRATRDLGISARRITISTVGLPAGIRRLAESGHGYHLAVSLHAPDDQLRTRLVPVNRQIGIAAVLEAADAFFARTGRRVTFEYVLLAEVNDRPEHARQLVRLLAGRAALVNLIPYNPVAGLGYHTPSRAAVAQFVAILQRGGLQVKVRHRKGDKIDAACGQLRRRQAAAGSGSGERESAGLHSGEAGETAIRLAIEAPAPEN